MDRENVEAKERGRPIDQSKNNLILKTTLNILADIGFLHLTMDKIAKEAKVSKAAIYRRWSSKEELVLEAVKLIDPFNKNFNLLEITNSKLSLRDQLVGLLCHSFLNGDKRHEYFTTILFAALPQAHMGNQDLYREFISNLQKAIETTLQPFLNPEQLKKKGKMLTDIVPSLIAHQVLLLGRAVNKGYIENIVDEIILPSIEYS
ncbi:TetR/AcrR family transcriptional regulator [Bacillus sp. JZ8]